MNRETALKWLYGQLRKRRIALGQAEKKPNVDAVEVENLQSAIDVIEWLIGVVLERSSEE